MILYLW